MDIQKKEETRLRDLELKLGKAPRLGARRTRILKIQDERVTKSFTEQEKRIWRELPAWKKQKLADGWQRTKTSGRDRTSGNMRTGAGRIRTRYEEPVYSEPVYQEPSYKEPVYTKPHASEIQNAISQDSLPRDSMPQNPILQNPVISADIRNASMQNASMQKEPMQHTGSETQKDSGKKSEQYQSDTSFTKESKAAYPDPEEMAPQAYEEMDAGILPQVYEEIRAVEIQAEEIVKSRAARSTSEKPHRTGQDIGGVSGDPVSGKIESPGVMPSGAVPPVAMYPEALSPGTVPTETLSPGTISSGTAPPDTAFSEEHSSEILASKYAAGLAGEEKIQKTGLQAALEAREGEGKFRQESLREPSTDSQTATNADHPSETYLPYEALRQEAEEAGRKATLQKPGGPETPRQTAADQSTFKQRAAEGKERERTELYATGNKVAEHARYFAAIEQANTERIKVHTERIRDHTIPQVGAAFPGGKPVSSPLAGTGRKGSVFSGKRITGSSNMYQPKQSGIAGTIRNKLFALAGMAAGGMYTQIAAGEAISREVHGEEPVVRTLRHATGKIVRGTLSAATVKIRKGASIVFVKILPYVAGLIILMMAVILLLVMFSGTTITESNASGGKAINLSAEVEAYRPQVTQAAAKYGISAYVDLLLAVMMQESAGRGLDPMQASEGGFNTRFPREPGGITDPAYSIECGVQELKKALDVAGVTSPTDKTKIEICLQGYNFGYGYIYWMERHGYDTWSFETACAFAESTGWGLRMNPDSAAGPYRYGDQYYPEHVLRYYDFNATSPVPSGGLPIPLYYQWEYADVAYGEATVKETGCAPTAMSMVVSYLSGQTVTPREMVAWSGNRFYVGTIGTGWSFFSAAAAHFGVGNVTETGSAQEVLDALRAGRPVISSQSAGIFTSQGHFIVLRGVTAEGRILVNDPNDSEAKNFANRTFDFYSEIDATSKRYWIFDAKGD